MEFLQEHMVTKQELKEELKNMVTKQELKEELQKLRLDFLDSLDEKISTLKGDLTVMMRGEDKKLVALMNRKLIRYYPCTHFLNFEKTEKQKPLLIIL